jgi:hypothetical protein
MVTGTSAGTAVPDAVADVLATATGAAHRRDPVSPRHGGPAGNARLTAWLGLVLLALSLAELVTLVSLGSLIGPHIVIGALLVPPTLAKTATTGWRIARYYAGDGRYRAAGPPPLLLRVLGPLVVLGGLAVLGSGLALVAVGGAAHDAIVTVMGFRVDAVTVHQACFAVWAVAVGAHVLVRAVPAWQLATGRAGPRALPGRRARALALGTVAAAAAVAGGVVLTFAGFWT